MTKSEIEGFLQVRPYPIDAVPYPLFAQMIGKKESAVATMVENSKLPLVKWEKPGSTDNKKRADNWIYLPAFNLGMQKAFFEQEPERRDAWLLWLGL